MLIVSKDRKKFLHAIINTWLKDTRMYCNNCAADFKPELKKCCEDSQIGDNYSICKAVVEQNKMVKSTRVNSFASTSDKTLRWGVSLPLGLYQALERLCKKHDNLGLFNEKYDVSWFAKNFPQFAIPEKI